MKFKFLFLFLFLAIISFGQSSSYIGFVVFRPCSFKIIPPPIPPSNKFITIQTSKDYDLSECKSDTNRLKLYRSLDDSLPKKTLSFYTEFGNTERKPLFVADSLLWLEPVYSELANNDYCTLIFVCKRKMGRWLEIVVNDSTGKTMWVEKSKLLKFVPWNKLSFKKIGCVGAIEYSDTTVLHKKPNEHSDSLKNTLDFRIFKIVRSKGDWLKVSSEYGDGMSSYDTLKGWVKFREGEKLLLDFTVR